jgi:hypothetical protein
MCSVALAELLVATSQLPATPMTELFRWAICMASAVEVGTLGDVSLDALFV